MKPVKVQPINKLPGWAARHLRETCPTWAPPICCSGWVPLSKDAILVLCNYRDHTPRDIYKGHKVKRTGFILKTFGHTPIQYPMKLSRALKGRRPYLPVTMNRAPIGAGWYLLDHKTLWARYRLTDEEWSYAYALMY
jgi:hypothetical protein